MKRRIPGFFASRMFVFIALIVLQVWIFIWLMFLMDSVSDTIRIGLMIASILAVLWITSKPQNPAYKIGWIILILALPAFGLSMYFFFSQRPLSVKTASRFSRALQKTRRFIPPTTELIHQLNAIDETAASQAHYLEGTSPYPLYCNTDTKYYATGEAFFADLLLELRKAERYICMEYFIVQEGVMWDSILEILEQKAASGVAVYFLYDDIGCITRLPNHYDRFLENKGIHCTVFNPLRPIANSMFNNRDHRKITVIDGITGFCGGTNLADEYINKTQKYGHWKDASIMLKGDAVRSLLTMFLQLYAATTEEEIEFKQFEIPQHSIRSSGYVLPFSDAPFDDTYLSLGAYINMISRANKYIYINTPYLILNNELITALQNAALSGVDVRITVPHIADKKVVFMVTQANYEQLLKAGVRIYEYTPGFLHSKTVVCDDQYGIVGTINLDFRSFYLHFECGVWMYNTDSIQDIKKDYLDTLKISQEISYADTVNRNIFKRFIQSILKMFGPLM